MSKKREATLKTFDDFQEAVLKYPLPEGDGPHVGDEMEGKKIVRVKLIGNSELVKSIWEKWEVDETLLFKSHATRPFATWIVEVK